MPLRGTGVLHGFIGPNQQSGYTTLRSIHSLTSPRIFFHSFRWASTSCRNNYFFAWARIFVKRTPVSQLFLCCSLQRKTRIKSSSEFLAKCFGPFFPPIGAVEHHAGPSGRDDPALQGRHPPLRRRPVVRFFPKSSEGENA